MKKFIPGLGLLALIISCNQPVAVTQNGAPVINPPTVIGNYPDTPFLFAIPTQGIRPVKWTADNLPHGLEKVRQCCFTIKFLI